MSKNPFAVDENTLASDVLSQMNKRKLQTFVYLEKIIKKQLNSSHTQFD